MTANPIEVTFWRSVREDLRAHLPPEQEPETFWKRFLRGLNIAARSPGFHVAMIHRCSRALHPRLGPFGRIASALLFWVNRHLYACSIPATASIGGGLILPHPQGIVIGPGVEIGPRAWIYQNVTIGGAPGREGMPKIGRDARIFCGAVLTGPVVLGDNVVIGANAVVHRDVPDRTFVRSAPVESEPLPERYRVGEPHE